MSVRQNYLIFRQIDLFERTTESVFLLRNTKENRVKVSGPIIYRSKSLFHDARSEHENLTVYVISK